jgi:RNA polymerase sigma-70 factor (ECF subfamily)
MRQAISDTEPSDAVLVDALETQGPSALAPIYDRYAGLVYGIGMQVLRDADAAADLTQEVFVTFSAKPAFDPSRGALGALLATMARTRAIDRVRYGTRSVRLLRRHHESEPPPPGPPTPADAMSVAERTERVRAALAELSGDERRVLELAYWGGLTQAEIAAELDTPLGTVKSWMRRGLLRMRGTLGDLVE